MKKVSRINVVIARFGSDPETIEVAKDSTIEDVLITASMTDLTSEKIWVNGEKANRKDIIENNDNILIVSPKEAGI